MNGPGRCAECHSNRNILDGLETERPLRGNKNGPDNRSVPAIAGLESKIREWDESEIRLYLQNGIRPDGDAAEGAMSEVIFESTELPR